MLSDKTQGLALDEDDLGLASFAETGGRPGDGIQDLVGRSCPYTSRHRKGSPAFWADGSTGSSTLSAPTTDHVALPGANKIGPRAAYEGMSPVTDRSRARGARRRGNYREAAASAVRSEASQYSWKSSHTSPGLRVWKMRARQSVA